MAPHRPQQTITSPVEIEGTGLFMGESVRLRFLPAPPNHGIVFQRLDLADSPQIPARIEYIVSSLRRTAIEYRGASVQTIEHVMAALAGLCIDNCLVQLNSSEPPGCDGSAGAFVDCLSQTRLVQQSEVRKQLVIESPLTVSDDKDKSQIVAEPHDRPGLVLSYHLDYGEHSPIGSHAVTVELTPASFKSEVCFARTFLLESEATALRAQGYGRHITPRDLLVFGSDGVIDNALRAPDECARHKILDCLGDFALLGCDVVGQVSAIRSGHHLNHQWARKVKSSHPEFFSDSNRRVA